ncbi:hypothetical protein [Erythrobacter sp. EC-HK427]|uniref:hypothetical protein n=1 Tax=Erythrobacter sp. EC-HK427 TaxID=2038396 RepID=UPI0012577609|nr:hypothetical protein [Erythrobacter sp. EC-HK427]VVT16021.1 conserved hypothetical protein [Erythrobacter sp. EC-HK427]
MAEKHLMIAVNWFGPYWGTLEETRAVARRDFDDGLYMCLGKAAYQRKRSMQYVGIGTPLCSRLSDSHHALPRVTRERQIWLGEVATAEPSGKKIKATKATLDYAEWLHARFMQLPLNDKKTKGLPPRSVTVLNRWWKQDYVTMRDRRPHPDWPDFIDFPGHDLTARMVWFGAPGKQSRFTAPEY